MLKSLRLKNFTVFQDANLTFAKNLNVFVGENGTGKTHILKSVYSAIAVLADAHKRPADATRGGPGNRSLAKSHLQTALAEKLIGVFRPDALGRLVRRAKGRLKSDLAFRFDADATSLDFSFSRQATRDVKLSRMPSAYILERPIYLPTRELLSVYPGFVSLYETTHLPFEETWRDTCLLLGAPLARGVREARINELLKPLEVAMGGKIELDRSGGFYLNLEVGGRLEIHLVAEGLRKLATVARLIATGSLLDKGYLFWDEPESNLNPRIIKAVAKTILQIAAKGIQVFIATHSLFLLRELHILQRTSFADAKVQYFGLHLEDDGSRVAIKQGPTIDDIGDITALDEDLEQSDRYMDVELAAGKPPVA